MENVILDNVTNLTIDISELVVDSFLNDGLLKDIPIVGTGVNIIKLTSNISDTLLLNKLKIFMENLRIINQNDVERFKEKMKNDKFKKDIGIKLLNIVNKTDEYIKIKWIANSFLEYLDGFIDKNFFFRIVTIINNTFVQDIIQLKHIKDKEEILSNNKRVESYVLNQLFSNGLLDNCGIDGGGASDEVDSGTIYVLNIFGEYIKKLILK